MESGSEHGWEGKSPTSSAVFGEMRPTTKIVRERKTENLKCQIRRTSL
jgi:hypothetical protein